MPAQTLFEQGERHLEGQRYEQAREHFQVIIESYPDTDYAPRARFMMGETYYRDEDYENAVKQYELFLARYPSHPIADMVQYRIALSYWSQLKTVERDQGMTAKAMAALQKFVRTYPQSRYVPDALAKIALSRERLAQKELFVANYYYKQGNYNAALQRLEIIVKDYPRTLVVPETLYLAGAIHLVNSRPEDGTRMLRRVVDEYPHSVWAAKAKSLLRGPAR